MANSGSGWGGGVRWLPLVQGTAGAQGIIRGWGANLEFQAPVPVTTELP
jgi:hypothetical protein